MFGSLKAVFAAGIIGMACAGGFPAGAVTVTEQLARITSQPGYFFDFGPGAYVGMTLDLSTSDNWQTADFVIRVAGNKNTRPHDTYIAVGSEIAVDWRSPFFNYTDPTSIGFSVPHGTRVKFGLASLVNGQPVDVWRFLSTAGIGVDQGFFGNEYFNSANIILSDRSITRYRFDLFDVAKVPLPATALLLPVALAGLVSVRRRGSK